MSQALEEIDQFTREKLLSLLLLRTEEQQFFFKRMYSHLDLDKDITLVVQDMDIEKIPWAIQQCENTG